jgi:capsular polysaccharide biosynthesis protein
MDQMNQTKRHEPTPYREEQFDDEIELMDYLRVIWKWKYLILAGTLICGVGAGVISLSIPKVYRIDMMIRPGILKVNKAAGKDVYVDSPENIKTIVEGGAFDRELLNNMGESHRSDLAESLSSKINITVKSNTLKVSCQTSDVDRGLHVLDSLGQVLSRSSERVEYFQNEYERQIVSKKDIVGEWEVRRRGLQQDIKNIQRRIDELIPQIEFIKNNRNSLMKQRNKLFSSGTKESNVVAAVFYANTIQQADALEIGYRREVDRYMTEIDDKKLKLKELNGESRRLLEGIKDLESKKNNLQNIEILQPPTRSPHPIKPKIKRNVMLATVVALFVMLFLAFFLEYIQKHRGEPGA